jgi:FixJ family two-component response regulator
VAIVEDDAAVRRALARVLAAAGFQVDTFGSAEEFLVGGLDPPPQCALIDIHLPMMNGIELRDHMIRAVPTSQAVFITADYQLAREHRDPRDAWLVKPVDEDSLIHAIAHACSRSMNVAAYPKHP